MSGGDESTDLDFDAAAWREDVMAAALASVARATTAVYRVEHDGFEGTEIGSYVTREGKEGVVLQQIGTKVVHVYRRDRVTRMEGE